MTPDEWNDPKDLDRMLKFLRNRISERKLRLLATAGIRRFCSDKLAEDAPGRQVLETVERLADQLADAVEFQQVRWTISPAHICWRITESSAFGAAWYTVRRLPHLLLPIPAVPYSSESPEWQRYFECVSERDRRVASFVPHIIGNPFRPYAAPDRWPNAVVQLAESLYNGADCGFALHDALLDAGHTDLAEHFEQEQWHPKGCWVVDLILSKDR